MTTSDSMRRAIKKYNDEKIDRISFRVPKGKRGVIQDHAAKRGESVNAFLTRAVEETMERDNGK